MITTITNEEAIEKLISQLENFVWTERESQELEALRQGFLKTYHKDRIENLTKEEYFQGLGRKQGCMAYDLEWGTSKLGSIKGGSKQNTNTAMKLTLLKSNR